jgi:BASS family bile acid:Na+ symporter
VLLHNALGFGGGYAFSALLGNTRRDRRTISIETGIQNTGLGLVLIFGQFGGLGGMAMMAALYGIWHLITGLGISLYWSRINPDVS